jgi:hypothetical protein
MREMGQATEKKRKQKASPAAPGAFRRGAISVFILFHLVAIACWALPVNFWLTDGVRELIRPYMLWTGLFQSWDTFAPNPPTANGVVRAVVETRDHHMRVWAFPRMEQLGYGERYAKERYRKFSEVLLQPNNAGILPDVARHIARLANDPGDPPVKVILVEYVEDIPAAGAQPAPGKTTAFFEQPIQPEDLR